jgi:thiol-disulfide isomerase/thioredoxin
MSLFKNSGENSYMNTLQNFKNSITSKLSITNIVVILVVVLFIGIGIYIYTTKITSKFSTSYSSNNEHTMSDPSGKSSEAELILFYADWCPHCKTAKPVWEELKAEYDNKTINGYSILFTEVNCTNESPEVEKMMNTYKIEGFPTVKLLKDGQVVEYDAKVTKETLVQFLNTVL